MRIPGEAPHRHPLLARQPGRVFRIDNRKLAKLAKLAGAPDSKTAGVEMHVRLGDQVLTDQPLCVVHAETPGELEYALDFAAAHFDIIEVSAHD